MADMPQFDTTSTPLQGDLPDTAATSGTLPISGQAPPNVEPMGTPAPTGASPWRAILAGALFGLANSTQPGHGRGSFASGLGMGAEGAVVGAQREFENKQKQAAQTSAIKFQSAQAANLLVEARLHQAQLDNLPRQEQDAHNQANVETLERLKNAFPGLQVVATNNDHDSITVAMQSATQTQGGVPAAIHLNVGKQMFSIPLDQEAITNSGGAALGQVNDMLKKQGSQQVTSAVWANMNPTQRAQMLDQSVHFSNPLPSEDNLKTYKNFLATAEANKDSASAQFLKPIVDKLQTAVNAENTRQAGIAAQMKAAEARGTELGKESTPGGQATLAKTKAETGKAELDTQQLKQDIATLGQPDSTGFTTNLDAKEYNKRFDKFMGSKEYQNLQTLQGSYQQFQSVQKDIAAGKGMTGAQSVVGLFNAIGISATPLAGKGFRINANTIEEHVGARGIDQAAYQKLLSLKNGDVITPQQLTDYAGIASQVYRDAYVNAANDAHSQGLKVTFLPQGNNENLDAATAGIFLKLAGGDKDKARGMAQQNSWKF